MKCLSQLPIIWSCAKYWKFTGVIIAFAGNLTIFARSALHLNNEHKFVLCIFQHACSCCFSCGTSLYCPQQRQLNFNSCVMCLANFSSHTGTRSDASKLSVRLTKSCLRFFKEIPLNPAEGLCGHILANLTHSIFILYSQPHKNVHTRSFVTAQETRISLESTMGRDRTEVHPT